MSKAKIPVPNKCLVCTNEFELLDNVEAISRHCPFCRSQIWPEADTRTVTEIGSFSNVALTSREAPAAVFEATRQGSRYLITFLDSGDHQYNAGRKIRDEGGADYFDQFSLDAHPNVIRTYPIEWIDDVAILSVDFFDGQSLVSILQDAGPVHFGDAVLIGLCCLRFVQFASQRTGESRLVGAVSPRTILITTDGEVKFRDIASHRHTMFEIPIAKQLSGESYIKSLSRISEHRFAPEFKAKDCGTYVDRQFRLNSIYQIGCLVYELISGRTLASQSVGKKNPASDFISLKFFRPDVPEELAEVIKKMTRKNPRVRYSDYGSAIEDLESLGIASDTVSFGARSVDSKDADFVDDAAAGDSSGSVCSEQALPERSFAAPCVWENRIEGTDFRKVVWGMTAEEVKSAEPSAPDMAMPYLMAFQSSYEGFPLQVGYQFADLDDEVICVSATLQHVEPSPATMFESMRGLHDSKEIDEECKQLRREGLTEEAERRLRAHTEKRLAELQEMRSEIQKPRTGAFFIKGGRIKDGRMEGGTLDVEAMEEVHQVLSDLITRDYGEPESCSEEHFDEPEYLLSLQLGQGIGAEELRRHCRATTWFTDSTQAVLRIIPVPFGGRMIFAQFGSRKYRHLLQGAE